MDTLSKSLWSRLNLTVWILIVIVLIIALQNTLAAEVKIGAFFPRTLQGMATDIATNQIWLGIKILVLVPIIVFWVLDRRRPLRYALLLSLALLTLELFSSILLLVLSLANDTSKQATGLLRDTITVALINILVFSLWYWIIDAYPLAPPSGPPEANEFLFPQFANSMPKYANWRPNYMDYLFVAFTATTAFGPTDTLPLSRRAKFLMMLQAALSLVIIIVLAGRALSILR